MKFEREGKLVNWESFASGKAIVQYRAIEQICSTRSERSGLGMRKLVRLDQMQL